MSAGPGFTVEELELMVRITLTLICDGCGAEYQEPQQVRRTQLDQMIDILVGDAHSSSNHDDCRWRDRLPELPSKRGDYCPTCQHSRGPAIAGGETVIEIKTTLTLRCERCKATFLYVADLEAGEPSGAALISRSRPWRPSTGSSTPPKSSACWLRKPAGPRSCEGACSASASAVTCARAASPCRRRASPNGEPRALL